MGLIIFLLLPALGYARITIDIQAAPTFNQSFATALGEDSSVITDQELEPFHITDCLLKKAVRLHSGCTPSNVFVKSPTPWGDLYKTNNWPEVKRETKVKNITIFFFNAEEVTLATEKMTNAGSKDANFMTSIEPVKVENCVLKRFSGPIMEVDVNYNVDLIVNHHPEIKSNLKFDSTSGKGTMVCDTKLRKASVARVVLKPNQTAEVVFNATRVSMGVAVFYETSLSGHVAVNYDPRYKDHHFWAYDVKEVMKAGGLPVVETEIDLITVEFYSHFNVIAFDSQNKHVTVSKEAHYSD